MRGHAARERSGGLCAVDGGKAGLEDIKPRMAKARVDMPLTLLPRQRPGAVEERLVVVLRVLGAGVDEGRGQIDRRLDRAERLGRVIAKGDSERFGA